MDAASDARLALELVRDAGRLALRMRADGVDRVEKTSITDIVTAADHAAEALVVRRLREERPDDGILGEEGSEQASASGRTWVVDPVDGTWNFFHGLTWWCSALALAEAEEVLLGAVSHPHDGTAWVGGPGRPTTRNGVRVSEIEDRPLATAAVATYLHPPWYADPEVHGAFARVAGRAATLRMLGSGSMDLAAVADGRLDLWFQHSVPAWDWLPGKALVEGAGGATARVVAGGKEWSVAGAPTAVGEALVALADG